MSSRYSFVKRAQANLYLRERACRSACGFLEWASVLNQFARAEREANLRTIPLAKQAFRPEKPLQLSPS